ncbi:MAG: CAP domain-containing protein [Anaerolineae bacterium]
MSKVDGVFICLTLILITLFGLCLSVGMVSPSPTEGFDQPTRPGPFIMYLPFVQRALYPPPPPTPTYEQEVVELVNQERAARGLPPLKICPELMAAASGHSQDMATNDFFSHIGSDGSSPWDRFRREGYQLTYGGEDIAAGDTTPHEVVSGWMSSPGHSGVILDPRYREVGVGYAYSSFGHFWTLDVASRDGVYPLVIEGEALVTTSRDVDLYVYGAEWATQIRVSNESTFEDTSWEAYTPARIWTLTPGPGWKTVYVELQHEDGAILAAADDIYLANPEPPPYP